MGNFLRGLNVFFFKKKFENCRKIGGGFSYWTKFRYLEQIHWFSRIQKRVRGWKWVRIYLSHTCHFQNLHEFRNKSFSCFILSLSYKLFECFPHWSVLQSNVYVLFLMNINAVYHLKSLNCSCGMLKYVDQDGLKIWCFSLPKRNESK